MFTGDNHLLNNIGFDNCNHFHAEISAGSYTCLSNRFNFDITLYGRRPQRTECISTIYIYTSNRKYVTLLFLDECAWPNVKCHSQYEVFLQTIRKYIITDCFCGFWEYDNITFDKILLSLYFCV